MVLPARTCIGIIGGKGTEKVREKIKFIYLTDKKMSLLVLAYPHLASGDFQLIQQCRQQNDVLHFGVVDPHFTFVFPVNTVSEEQLLKEMKAKAKGFGPIDFVLRCAVINKDAFRDYYHVFLVPEEGYSRIVRLHDKLYSDFLQPELRLDIDFIPHIGIANSKDAVSCKRLADKWNEVDFAIAGTISELTLVKYENNQATKLDAVALE
jgi:2'-5' RNA ligase